MISSSIDQPARESFSTCSFEDSNIVQASAAAASAVSEDTAISEASAAVPGAVADASAEVAALAQSNGSGDGDVYVADQEAGPGVWEVDNVLDAEYDPRSQPTAYESRTLSLEVRAACLS